MLRRSGPAEGVLRLPVGDGQEPCIDTADIAAVAVEALTGDGHERATYELSGPELLTFDEAIQRLARTTAPTSCASPTARSSSTGSTPTPWT